MAPSYRRLQQFALGISIVSIVYNGAEGAVSIGLGSKSSARSLVFFGVQSAIEVLSAAIVVWRFNKVARPGEEKGIRLGARELRIEKYASASIGMLLIALSVATEITAIVALCLHQKPDSSSASIIISASAFVIMVGLWLPKRYLARALDSSVMAGEATCSLSCIQITVVLFVGSLIFRIWPRGWWMDSATSLILGLLFGWEGYKMIIWVRDPEFDGGCCKQCRVVGDVEELGETYRDLCECCAEKNECRDAGECQCSGISDDKANNSKSCCTPRSSNDSKCCSHKVLSGTSPRALNKATPKESDNCASITQTGICASDACCSTKPKDDTCCTSACTPGSSCAKAPANSPACCAK